MERNLEERIIELVQGMNDIPEAEKMDIIEFASHNEWGLALDTLSFQLDEHDILITNEDYQEIARLGDSMNMQESIWIGLKRLIKP